MKLYGKEPEWKFTASSYQVSVQLTWIKTKEPDTSSRKPKPALKSNNKPPSTRRCNAKRFAEWIDTKSAVVPATPQHQSIKATVDYSSQTEARNTVVGKQLAPNKYRGEPVGVIINTDIVTSPYNHRKVCHRLYYYTSATERGKSSRIDLDEEFDIDDPELLRTPPHTSPFKITSKEAIKAAILAEQPDTPYQHQHRSRSKMKAKRQAEPTL
ncbi:unnamed protein product [Mytilus coruscus]|uniref:Uncharacterized protein n=1 Tax=Mytilus coruscus TaxID=42192 RepID=A0A6J8CZ24_MYTCO|nr:unnamed protein product [Mytilus coruscus]